MREDYIAISLLNDFIFCPYSIYLHKVYKGVEDSLYQATPQLNGKNSHFSIDNQSYSSSSDYLIGIDIISEKLGVFGKIDLYNLKTKSLIERKYKLVNIYIGQSYQLWAQFFCMKEMGYKVKEIIFYSYSNNKKIPVDLPNNNDLLELKRCINNFKDFEPVQFTIQNINKCKHCIYCNLCDKTDLDNVY